MKQAVAQGAIVARQKAVSMCRAAMFDRPLYRLDPDFPLHGGDLVARALQVHNVKQVFTLAGGHISPILTACEALGIRVVDTRHEASAAFAADAAARVAGGVGVCVVTAGPGITNTITAVKNAQMAESPVLLIGGAAPSLLRGRGALQDIDQVSVLQSLCKDTIAVDRVRDVQDAVCRAIQTACTGIPGPVFLELPVDVLYPYNTVKQMSGVRDKPRGIIQKVISARVNALFAGVKDEYTQPRPLTHMATNVGASQVEALFSQAKRPVVVVGTQALIPHGPKTANKLAYQLKKLGAPVYLGGMSRGLLGADHRLLFRQTRRTALKEADVILLAGAITDFRLDYGRSLNPNAKIIALNRSEAQLRLNNGTFWKPTVASISAPTDILPKLSTPDAAEWIEYLREKEDKEESKISSQGTTEMNDGVNSVTLFKVLDSLLTPHSLLIGDGGDFVGTAARILRPRAPLSWLDPGAFGTLGVGGGFALGAKSAKPSAEVWVLWGDGSCAYSIAEVEAATRLGLPFIAIIGNDGSWKQIERDQVKMLGSDVACRLDRSTQYHQVSAAYGGIGLNIGPQATEEDMREVLISAQDEYRKGKTVIVNVVLGHSKFRDGSISV